MDNNKDIRRLFEKFEELHVMVSMLSVMTKSGFKGIEKRQNITNGRIGKLEEDTKDIDDTVKSNARRVEDIEDNNKRQKIKMKEEQEGSKWLKREFISTIISIISIILTAIILLILRLK